MFIQIIQGTCTKPDELRAMADRWRAEIAPTATGWLGGTYGFTDDGTFVGVIRFESKEAAMAHSESPAQTAWWEEASRLFDGPVEFHNAEDVSMMLGGGSDDAGFVQVIRGKVADPSRLKAILEQDTDTLHRMRPEILGGTLAIEEDGTFTETVAFTDEESARRGEQQEMPEEMREGFEEAMRDVTYLDLHHPWFASRETSA
ncbi:MAG TPA: hypothetical protein VFM50_05985 [Nocardioidaceae bacterium]|nr:hypothetical protein [Nocardioidaceae bacterium]